MKTYILLTLALMSFASATHSKNKPFLLARVLFYNDGKGHQIVAAGHIPKKIYKEIRKDIVGRLGNTTAKIVAMPLLHNIAAAPSASKVRTLVKNTFLKIYSVKIPSWLASQVVNRKSKKITSRDMKNNGFDNLALDTQNNEEALNTNLISEGKFDETSNNNNTEVLLPYYLPNTVFYSVQTKCLIPTDYSCYLNKKHHHNITDTHHKNFKKMFKKIALRDSNF